MRTFTSVALLLTTSFALAVVQPTIPRPVLNPAQHVGGADACKRKATGRCTQCNDVVVSGKNMSSKCNQSAMDDYRCVTTHPECYECTEGTEDPNAECGGDLLVYECFGCDCASTKISCDRFKLDNVSELSRQGTCPNDCPKKGGGS